MDLNQQGELLLQGSFFVVSENKRDIRLRIRPRRRHIFLYEKSMLFCKPAAKNSHNKATYHFKHDLQVSNFFLILTVLLLPFFIYLQTYQFLTDDATTSKQNEKVLCSYECLSCIHFAISLLDGLDNFYKLSSNGINLAILT